MGIYGSPDLSTGQNSDARFYKCKKCGHEYIKEWEHCPQCRTARGKGAIRPIFLILLALSLIAFFIEYSDILNINNQNKNSYIQNPDGSITPNDLNINSSSSNEIIPIDINNSNSFDLNPVETPSTGVYQLFTNNELVAPFEIRNHIDDKCYLLKFVDTNNDSTSFTIFLNKQENCNVKVPLGTYTIMTASGTDWYGDRELFGPSTIYQRYNNTYPFYIDLENYNYRGWFIDMNPSSSGNLETNYISEDDFQ